MIALGEGYVYHGRQGSVANAFRYPTFFLFFRCDQEPRMRALFRGARGFLSLRAQDYLAGRSGALDERAREFFSERCGYIADEIWLHTLPRMFGYAFNPVSFWVARREGRIDAVLCEVNNTFGERHFYWLYEGGAALEGKWLTAEKIFHVSPFQPVEGSYRFRFQITSDHAGVDIHYHGPNGETRLTTYVKGALVPLERASGVRLLLRYGWLTPLVVFRIHFQALRLWIKRARFYKKPEPPTQEVSS